MVELLLIVAVAVVGRKLQQSGGLLAWKGKPVRVFSKNANYNMLYLSCAVAVLVQGAALALGSLMVLYGVVIVWLLAMAVRCTRIAPALVEKAQGLCETKLGDGLGSIFLLAVFCNMLIYIAVEGYNKNPHEVGKYLALFFGVVVFILSGFEHCVANMYYFSIAGMWSGKTLLYVLVMTAGNSVGGWVFPVCRRAVAGKI